MAFTIKRHDTRPTLVRQLLDGNLAPIPLGTATGVSFILSLKTAAIDDPPKFKKACAIDDAANGIVSYHWAAADTDTPGDYNGEFEIDWGGGQVETVPTAVYVDVTVKDDLG